MLAFTLIAVLVVPSGNASNFKSFKTTCPTSGAKQVNSSQLKVVNATIQSPFANTGNIFIGDSAVSTSSVEGIQLLQGDSYTTPTQGNNAAYDLSGMYFACSTNTDSIQVIYNQ